VEMDAAVLYQVGTPLVIERVEIATVLCIVIARAGCSDSFAWWMVFALHLENSSGERLIHHGDWRLFLVTPGEVEALFLDAHRLKWLDYQVAGRLVRVELHLTTPEEVVRAIAGQTDEDAGRGPAGRSHADQCLPRPALCRLPV